MQAGAAVSVVGQPAPVPALLFSGAVEEGGTEPTIPLLRRLAADVRLTTGHDLGSVWFETHAA